MANVNQDYHSGSSGESDRLFDLNTRHSSACSYLAITGHDDGYDEHTDYTEEDDEDDADDEDTELADGRIYKSEYYALPWSKRPSVYFLLVLLLMTIIGSVASTSTMLFALVYIICKDYYKLPPDELLSPVWGFASDLPPDDSRCQSPEVSAAVAFFTTYQTTIAAALTLFTVAQLSSYSDKIGRRPILLLASLGSVVDRVISVACCIRPDIINYRWMFLGAVISGLTGSGTLLVVMISSYISDSVKEVYRARVISYLDASVFAGIAFGPVVGSFILSQTDYDVIFLLLFSLACESLFFFGVLFALPESRTKRSRRKSIVEYRARQEQQRRQSSHSEDGSNFDAVPFFSRQGVLNLLKGLCYSTRILQPLQFLRFTYIRDRARRKNVYTLIGTWAILGELTGNLMPFMILLCQVKFNFTPIANNYFLSIFGTSRFVVLTVLLPIFLEVFGHVYTHSATNVDYIDKRMFQFSLFFSAFSLLVNAESQSPTVFFFSVATLSLGGMASPMLRNAIIKHAPENQVGEILGAACLVNNIFGVATPTVYATIYKYTIHSRKQAVIEIVAFADLLGLLALSTLTVHQPNIHDVETLVHNEPN